MQKNFSYFFFLKDVRVATKAWIQQILNNAHKKPRPYTTPMLGAAQLSYDLEDTLHTVKGSVVEKVSD